MKRKHPYILVLFITIIVGCSEHIDMSNRYVFKENTVVSYMQNLPNTYSTYLDLLYKVPVSINSKTSVGQLLTARGHYTVFAPTNKAISDYLNELVAKDIITSPSWDAFTDSTKLDSIRKVIVYNSIIDNGDNQQCYYVSDFPILNGGEFALSNMADHRLTIFYTDNPDSLYINKDCPININNRDITILNGVIHQMEKVIAPNNFTADVYLQDIIENQKSPYLVMARAIQACGLMGTLKAFRDEKYELMYQRGMIPDLPHLVRYGYSESGSGLGSKAPEHRKYGFTIFAETDDYWKSQGLDPASPNLLENLQKWVIDQHQYSDEDNFTTDEQYQSENNLLHQWVTYHILPMRIPSNRLVFHINEYGYNHSTKTLATPVYEYYTTFGKRRLLKLYESKESMGVYINRFPELDNKRKGTYREIGCQSQNVGCRVYNEDSLAVLSEIINCCIYPIDAPLSYNDNVRNSLARERIRFDAMSIFPEAMNNNIRKIDYEEKEDKIVVNIPPDKVYHYFEDLWNHEEDYLTYWDTSNFSDYQKDEIKTVGRFDLTFRLPPVPRRDIYELRYRVFHYPTRGIIQIYFGEDKDNLHVTGIPVDIRSTDSNFTGWYEDSDDQDYNSEIDKRMRNRNMMKGAYQIWFGNGVLSERHDKNSIRHIVACETMDPNKTYYMRVKEILDSEMKEFCLDYLELCSKEVYNNPYTPEDIW